MKQTYPWLALGIGLLLSLVLMRFSALNGDSAQHLPLLTALLMSELGLLATAIAVVVSLRGLRNHASRPSAIFLLIGNLILAVNLLRSGLALWPGTAGG